MFCASSTCSNLGTVLKPLDNKLYCWKCSNQDFFWQTFISPHKKQYVGLELEVINYPPNEKLKINDDMWIQKDDGSLSATGKELCLTLPLLNKHIKNEVTKLVTILKENNIKIDLTCGYHIHLDCSQYSELDIKNFVCYCINVQDSIFSLVSKSRRQNRFCMKIPKFSQDNNTLSLYYRNTLHCERYHWLNLRSYFSRKSIEIRLHQGTTDFNEIVNWSMLWSYLIRFVIKRYNTFKDDSDILLSLQRIPIPKYIIEYYQNKRLLYSE